MVRDGDGTWLRALVWLLVHGLPGRAAGDGSEFHVGGSANSADRGSTKDVLSVPGDPSRDDRHRIDISSGRERIHSAGETRWHIKLRYGDTDDAGTLFSVGYAGRRSHRVDG